MVKNSKNPPEKPYNSKISSLTFKQIFQKNHSIFSKIYINKVIFPFFDMPRFGLKSTQTLVNR